MSNGDIRLIKSVTITADMAGDNAHVTHSVSRLEPAIFSRTYCHNSRLTRVMQVASVWARVIACVGAAADRLAVDLASSEVNLSF